MLLNIFCLTVANLSIMPPSQTFKLGSLVKVRTGTKPTQYAIIWKIKSEYYYLWWFSPVNSHVHEYAWTLKQLIDTNIVLAASPRLSNEEI
jgi:hypothetical protein